MSYFAFVRPTDGRPFQVKHCHVNLWSLPRIVGREMYFDVGVHVMAGEGGLKKFDVALPFVAEELIDISTPLRSPVTSQLIFRRESVNGRISFSNVANLEISSVNQEDCKPGAKKEEERSLWHVSIPEIVKDQERYFRFRFPVHHRGRMWNNKRHLLLTYGALLDFRVADTREAPGDPEWDSVRDRIVPIQDLQFFVIAPLALQMHGASPVLHTSRILEGDSWKTFLNRKTRGERLVIYQWNKDSPVVRPVIDTSNPYRVFLDLSKEVNSVSVPTALQSTIVTVFVVALATLLGWRVVSLLDFASIKAAWTQYLTGLGIAGFLSIIVSKLGLAKKVWQVIMPSFKKIDTWWYGRR